MKKIQFELGPEVWESLPERVRSILVAPKLEVGYLLTTNSVKTAKGEKVGYLTGVQYLSPADESGTNLCTSATIQCIKACLKTSGRMGLGEAHVARLIRTMFFLYCFDQYRERLRAEIRALQRKADKKGMRLAIRLNGTSDVPWESVKHGRLLQSLMAEFPHAEFYDYTKHVGRCLKAYRERHGLERYSLTLSFSGTNWKGCESALKEGTNVAVVFDSALFPEMLKGFPIINGDAHDLRFLDERGAIVGLKFKLPRKGTGKGTLKALEVPAFVVSKFHDLMR